MDGEMIDGEASFPTQYLAENETFHCGSVVMGLNMVKLWEAVMRARHRGPLGRDVVFDLYELVQSMID